MKTVFVSSSARAIASLLGSLLFASLAAAAGSETRAPEDPNLVWTPNHVVLVSQQVAPGVFAVFPDDSAAKNTGGIPVATSGGFVIGDKGVLVIDTMLNRRLADQLLALIRAQTDKPIQYVVNTSYHGDHSYGNQFFPKDASIVQHIATQNYIHDHFPQDVTFMMTYFGKDSGMDELKPQPAQILLHDGADVTFDLGGKRVNILHLGFAQTDGDLFVWLPAEKVLFTGNPIISIAPSLPWLLDGKSEPSLATMRKLRALVPADAIIVPGHGKPAGVETIDYPIAYLTELRSQVRAAVDAGLSEQETVTKLAETMKQYSGYKIFPWVHSQVNVPKTYQEMKAQR